MLLLGQGKDHIMCCSACAKWHKGSPEATSLHFGCTFGSSHDPGRPGFCGGWQCVCTQLKTVCQLFPLLLVSELAKERHAFVASCIYYYITLSMGLPSKSFQKHLLAQRVVSGMWFIQEEHKTALATCHVSEHSSKKVVMTWIHTLWEYTFSHTSLPSLWDLPGVPSSQSFPFTGRFCRCWREDLLGGFSQIPVHPSFGISHFRKELFILVCFWQLSGCWERAFNYGVMPFFVAF